MQKHFFRILILVCLFHQQVLAQRKMKQMDSDKQAQEDEMSKQESSSWKDKISFGGNLGASFGSDFASVLLQPLVFYRITEKTMVGGGFTYIYWSQKYMNSLGKTDTYTDNVYGLNLFARQVIFNPLFVHAEYNPMNFTLYNYQTRSEQRVWQQAFYIGGGFQQKMSERGGYYFMVLYDVLWNANKSFYPSPYDIRMGFYF
jgi:hypothetical protein